MLFYTLTGIGKHGKFYNLTDVPLKDWEIEDTTKENIVVIDKKKDGKTPGKDCDNKK